MPWPWPVVGGGSPVVGPPVALSLSLLPGVAVAVLVAPSVPDAAPSSPQPARHRAAVP